MPHGCDIPLKMSIGPNKPNTETLFLSPLVLETAFHQILNRPFVLYWVFISLLLNVLSSTLDTLGCLAFFFF